MKDFTDQAALDLGVASAVPLELSLRDRFVIPPFSVLETRQDYWIRRKRAWLSLGIQSEVGREDGLIGGWSSFSAAREDPDGWFSGKGGLNATSVFDAVLCEVAYRWFCPPGGRVFDPFAGGSVRGIVAGALGRQYDGVDLRPEQVESNRAQAIDIFGRHTFNGDAFPDPIVRPTWHVGDAVNGPPDTGPYDFLFSCPPYGDLEVYSDDPADLSTMEHEAFIGAHTRAIFEAVQCLRNDRFAGWVVSDFRDKAGLLRQFVNDTVSAFNLAGAHLYNDFVLVNRVGSAAVRAPKQFEASRKMVRLHQHFLVFVKGDPRKATAAIVGER
jgi:hypothetical protein